MKPSDLDRRSKVGTTKNMFHIVRYYVGGGHASLVIGCWTRYPSLFLFYCLRLNVFAKNYAMQVEDVDPLSGKR